MKHRTVLSLVTALVLVTPAFADLQDWEFNVNGTDYYPANGDSFASVPGLNASGFNSTTGLGQITLTLNPKAAGSYYVGGFFFDPVGVPFYNEYGAVNGSPGSGQSYQIDIPEYDAVSPNHGTGKIVDNLAAEKLNGTNSVPGATDNYLNNCGANGGGSANASCNDLVSMAQAFKFSLTAQQEEVITFTLGTGNPGGFSLEDIHPVDGSNSSASDIFYSATAVVQGSGQPPPPPPTVPEPASWSLIGLAGGILALAVRCRAFRLNEGECK